MPISPVLIVDPGNYTPYYDANLCRALAAQGLDVEWVTSPYFFEPVAAPPGVRLRHAFFSAAERADVAAVSAIRQVRWLRRSLKFGIYPAQMWRFARELERRAPGVVHMQWSLNPPFDALMYHRWRELGWRVVQTAHDVLPNAGRARGPSRLTRLLFRTLYRAADRVVVHTEANRRAVLGLGVAADRVSILPMGDWGYYTEPGQPRAAARAALGLDAERPLALFFGLIKPYKGLHLLLQSLPHLLAAAPQAQVLVAGEPMEPMEPYYRQLAELGLADKVTWHLRYIPTAHVARYFSAADVVVLPYVDSTLSAVLVTAYNYGRPVVATAVGGLPELIEPGQSGLVVPPGDARAFGQAVGGLLADPALCGHMGERARSVARERHDWNHIGRLTAELYRSVGQNGRALPVTASAATGETAG